MSEVIDILAGSKIRTARCAYAALKDAGLCARIAAHPEPGAKTIVRCDDLPVLAHALRCAPAPRIVEVRSRGTIVEASTVILPGQEARLVRLIAPTMPTAHHIRIYGPLSVIASAHVAYELENMMESHRQVMRIHSSPTCIDGAAMPMPRRGEEHCDGGKAAQNRRIDEGEVASLLNRCHVLIDDRGAEPCGEEGVIVPGDNDGKAAESAGGRTVDIICVPAVEAGYECARRYAASRTNVIVVVCGKGPMRPGDFRAGIAGAPVCALPDALSAPKGFTQQKRGRRQRKALHGLYRHITQLLGDDPAKEGEGHDR